MPRFIQVSREEFDVMSAHFEGEARYFIDTASPKPRSRANKVTAGAVHSRAPRSDRGKSHVKQDGLLMLSMNGKSFTEGSNILKMAKATVRIFKADPTTKMARSVLIELLLDKTGFRINQVQPGITDLIKNGHLRYTGLAS